MGITMRSVKVAVLAWVALAVCVLATSYALSGTLDPGMSTDDSRTVVLEVQPGYLAWAAGIRPGQRVVESRYGDEPGGWRMVTEDEAGSHALGAVPYEPLLRISAIASLAGVACALLALVFVGLRRRRAAMLAVLAFPLAAVPYLILRSPVDGDAVGLAAGVLPAAWIASEARLRPRSLRLLLVALVGAIGLANLVGVAAGVGVAPALGIGGYPLGLVWPGVIVGLAGLTLAVGSGVTATRVGASMRGLRPLDGAVLGALIAVGLLVWSLGLADWITLVFALIALLGYALSRGTVTRALDRVLLAELREREALQATEVERARISREIHDDSLQALAGVIQQLEEPAADAAAARDALRTVAERLRSVATEMHPPVLDDLGLVPAIEAAANAVTSPPVGVAIENHSGYTRAERPPQHVELAAYRIVAEAIANAVRHAEAQHITVSGEVDRSRVWIEVRDDGVGITDERVETALRSGRLGLASMRRRADSIDATFEAVSIAAGGTRVSVAWTA